MIDNSNFLASQSYHRHQDPGPQYKVWDQFRRADGSPIYPQRPMLLGPIFTANASGAVPPASPLELTSRGSLFLTRPRLFDYIATRAELDAAAADLFAMMVAGKLDVEIGLKRPLAEAAEVHRLLEGRQTTGSVVLLP